MIGQYNAGMSSKQLTKFFHLCEEENQLDTTRSFIELVICSTCFGHVYDHHQELATILQVWRVACNSWLLVVGRSSAGQQAMRPGCPKHAEQITSSVKHRVVSNWFSSSHITTMHGQTHVKFFHLWKIYSRITHVLIVYSLCGLTFRHRASSI